MGWMLRVMGWIACGASALLLGATLILGVRSLGHFEQWRFERFEPRPDWTMAELAGQGIERRGYVQAIRGRLWVGWGSFAPERAFKPGDYHYRHPITADEAEKEFDSIFQRGLRPWGSGTERAWRFAGAGLRHRRDPIDPRIDRPRFEGYTLAVPFWMFLLLFGLWPGLFITRRLLRRKRYAAGLCPHCGYDLRATPDRCPECGWAVVAKRN